MIRAAMLVLLTVTAIQIAALPRERPDSHPIVLLARLADVAEQELEPPPIICIWCERAPVPALSQMPQFRIEYWLPQIEIEFPQLVCRLPCEPTSNRQCPLTQETDHLD
jgi:hypothetical protein